MERKTAFNKSIIKTIVSRDLSHVIEKIQMILFFQIHLRSSFEIGKLQSRFILLTI